MSEMEEQFMAVTGCDKDTAERLLARCQMDLDRAVDMFFDEAQRSPIAPHFDRLQEPAPSVAPLRRKRQRRSVFDGFRDFAGEASGSKRRTLAELFRPPSEIVFVGTLTAAREKARSEGRWLLVTLHNTQEFACQVLNRDLWSHPVVQNIIRDNFIFLQLYNDSEEGERYAQFYPATQFPHVAVLDPLTGERLVVWGNIQPVDFCQLTTEFLADHRVSPSHSPSAPRAIIDLSEEEQLRAAIDASLQSTEAKQEKVVGAGGAGDNDEYDDESSGCEDCSSDGTDVQSDDDSHVAEEHKANGNSQRGAPVEEEPEEEEVECEEGELATLVVRLPDGSRKTYRLAENARLTSLYSAFRKDGFGTHKYEFFTNFPRRNLNELDEKKTLKELGLAPQETLFAQLL